jgi:hypothetical protein
VWIEHNYLGVVPGAADCDFAGHTRNSGIGVDVDNTGGSATVGTYIYGNVIGCHSSNGFDLGQGIRIKSSWTHVGQDVGGLLVPNYLGVQPNGSKIPNVTGVTFYSNASVYTATNNSVTSNTIASNLGDGIDLVGPATSNNLISGTLIYGNGLDGICEDHAASDNVWTHVSIHQNGGLGINKNGDCTSQPGQSETIAPPYPVITSVNLATHVVRGTANASLACPFFCVTVELYRVFPNPTGFGEGQTFVGTTTTDGSGNWSLTDPSFSGGCYTAFQTTYKLLFLSAHEYSSEFGPDNCRTWLPLARK